MWGTVEQSAGQKGKHRHERTSSTEIHVREKTHLFHWAELETISDDMRRMVGCVRDKLLIHHQATARLLAAGTLLTLDQCASGKDANISVSKKGC